MWREATVTDTKQSSLRYARAIKDDYTKNFVDVRIFNILEDIMSSNFFDANFRATYVRYVIVSMMVMKNQGVLPLLGTLEKDTLAAEIHGKPHIDDFIL